MPTTTETVAARIRELRLALGWSQEELAEQATLSRDAIARIERGDRGPRLDTLELIANALEIPLPKLLDVEEPLPQRKKEGRNLARSLERSLDLLDPWLAEALITALGSVTRAHLRRHKAGKPRGTRRKRQPTRR